MSRSNRLDKDEISGQQCMLDFDFLAMSGTVIACVLSKLGSIHYSCYISSSVVFHAASDWQPRKLELTADKCTPITIKCQFVSVRRITHLSKSTFHFKNTKPRMPLQELEFDSYFYFEKYFMSGRIGLLQRTFCSGIQIQVPTQ